MTRARAGFTLAEVLASIVLLALLAVAAYPLAHRLAIGAVQLHEHRAIGNLLRASIAASHGAFHAGEHPPEGLQSRVRYEPLKRQDGQPANHARCWWRVSVIDPDSERVLASTLTLGAPP